MPIFGFECKSCHNEFETLVRASEKVVCPSCGSTRLDQQLSRIAKPASSGPGSDDFACAKDSGGGGGGGGHMCGGGCGCG